MLEDTYIDEDVYNAPLYNALEDTSWAINHGVLPVYSLLQNLSPEALQELEWAQYQMGAIMDSQSERVGI